MEVLEGGHGTHGLGAVLVGGGEVVSQDRQVHLTLEVPQGGGVELHAWGEGEGKGEGEGRGREGRI